MCALQRRGWICAAFIGCLAVDGLAQAPGLTKDGEGVREFVQRFYDWYVPTEGRTFDPSPVEPKRAKPRPSGILRLAPMKAAVAPELLRQLTEDYVAQERDTSGYIVGLDADPFLASQDPCERYEVVAVNRKHQSYWVDVRGVGGCEDHKTPDVTAEVVRRGATCLFVNFHYPGPYATDLLTMLRRLRAERRKAPR